MNKETIKSVLEQTDVNEIIYQLNDYRLAEGCRINFYRNLDRKLIAEICFIHPEKFETHGHIEFCYEYKMNDNAEWQNFKRCVTRILKYAK